MDFPTGTPFSARAARSWRKPRKGATPVPAPTMIIGRCGLAGGRNGMVGLRTKVNWVLFSMLLARWLEATPLKYPSPLRAGPWSTPTVRSHVFVTAGDEEIE